MHAHRLVRRHQVEAPAPVRTRALGLDLGQARDHTALALVEWTPDPTTGLHAYALRHLERVPLGTGYPQVVAHVAGLMASVALKDSTQLVVDATGVGRPVIDLLRQAGLTPRAVVVHGGNETTIDQNGYTRVPKRLLVSTAQVLLQARRLRFPRSLPHVAELEEELLRFEVKITDAGTDTYGAWREGAHDDLVFALCLGCWYGERVAATDRYARAHPIQPTSRRVDARPTRPSLIGKPTLVRQDDGRYRIERVVV
jgi:hypothetical protein